MPQGPQGMPGPQPTSGPPNLQAYNQGGSTGFNAGSHLQGVNQFALNQFARESVCHGLANQFSRQKLLFLLLPQVGKCNLSKSQKTENSRYGTVKNGKGLAPQRV